MVAHQVESVTGRDQAEGGEQEQRLDRLDGAAGNRPLTRAFDVGVDVAIGVVIDRAAGGTHQDNAEDEYDQYFRIGQALRGLKDVRIPMILTGVSYWVIGFPVAAFLGLSTPLGAIGVWWGLLASLVAAAGSLAARLWLITRD